MSFPLTSKYIPLIRRASGTFCALDCFCFEKTTTNKGKIHMPDSTIPKFLLDRAQTILKDMGVPEHLQGFTFLAEAAALKSLFTSNRYMQIYTHIAKAHNILSKTVTNSMSYALDCNRENICANLKINLNELCCSRVISMAALRLAHADELPIPSPINLAKPYK